MFLLETKCLEKIIAIRVLPIVLFGKVDSQSCVKLGEVFDQKSRSWSTSPNEGGAGLPSSKSKDLLRFRYSSSPNLNSDTCRSCKSAWVGKRWKSGRSSGGKVAPACLATLPFLYKRAKTETRSPVWWGLLLLSSNICPGKALYGNKLLHKTAPEIDFVYTLVWWRCIFFLGQTQQVMGAMY